LKDTNWSLATLEVYTALTYNSFMEFIEASLFTKHLYDYFTEDDYAELQIYLFQHPESGDIIPGSGGIRKLRWALPEKNKGKRGGARVIYYFKKQNGEIWLLTLYSKGETTNISADVLKQIAKEIQND
jgi:mRNA-degrading endonuclease RelE of RelBE toxin-antitoxin system